MKYSDLLGDTPCWHAYWSAGYPIPQSSGYPERAWGAYLPGDSPGWKCELTEDGCIPEECPHRDEEEDEDE